MTKLAAKVPAPVKTVVSTEKHVADVWYAKPRNLGRIVFRNHAWFTTDGMRFASSRDAMEYLIRLVDGLPADVPPKRAAASAGAPPVRLSADPFVRDLIEYLRAHPDVSRLLKP